MPGAREEHLNWDEYFMGCAILASTRSKDPSTQVGACIVKEDSNQILSLGYNGLTRGMDDKDFYWNSIGEKTGEITKIKDYFVVHAERNAILNYRGVTTDLVGATLYVTLFPCVECTKEIIQAGIKKIVYLRMYSKLELVNLSKMMLDRAGVEVVEYNDSIEVSKEDVRNTVNGMQKILKRFSIGKE